MIDQVSVLAWNLGHKVWKSRRIPASLGIALAQIGTDVIFLSEYVDQDDGDKTQLIECLDEAGYLYRTMAPAPSAYRVHHLYNRIFAASRLPFEIGDVLPPKTDGFATSNFLHLKLLESEIELIGVRAPAYDGKLKTGYRRELTAVLRSASGDRALAIAGDWNRYPFKLIEDLYSVPQPDGPWSYLHSSGDSKLDFIAHTPRISMSSPPRYQYPVDEQGTPLAGLKANGAITDHAPLVFTAVLK